MKAYIQTDKSGNYFNVSAYVANEGFQTLGWETETFFSIEDITDTEPEHLIVGGIGNVRKRLEKLGFKSPLNQTDYPKKLEKYLCRKIWVSTTEDIFENENLWNIFIKPKNDTKKFAGKVVKEYKDFIGIVDKDNPTQVWCSEIVEFKTEWRCFIRYGEILDIRQYKGAWDSKLDLTVIKNAIVDFTNAPSAYALDFGIDDNNKMRLVEFNDGHSLGTYGINSTNYAKFLSARWAQLTNTTDYANF